MLAATRIHTAEEAPDTPTSAAVLAARRRVLSRLPHLKAKVERHLRLAEIDLQGPDPEVALRQLERAAHALDAFLRLTPRPP